MEFLESGLVMGLSRTGGALPASRNSYLRERVVYLSGSRGRVGDVRAVQKSDSSRERSLQGYRWSSWTGHGPTGDERQHPGRYFEYGWRGVGLDQGWRLE